MPNDYYALMQNLQAPGLQRQQNTQQGISQLISTVMQEVLKKKIKKDIESKITEAQDKGYQVEYKIDPATGQTTPVITSGKGIDAETWKSLTESGDYEAGMTPTGKRTLKKKKKIDSATLAGINSELDKIGSENYINTTIPNPATKQPEDLDLRDRAQAETALSYLKIEGGFDNPELVEAGITQKYEDIVSKINQVKSKKVKSPKTSEGDISTELLKNSQVNQHPIVKRALEIQARNPKIKPKEAVAQAQKELEEETKVIGKFKSGDIQEKDGKKYIRDDMGKWYSLDTE